jgi:NAD(P)-dependent dehydrogenase (short-subunit alcohol dehydrogenase family)
VTARVAIVTGANRGLGFEVARVLATRGLRVVLTARTQAKADDAAATLTAQGLDVLAEVVDVASDESVEAFVVRFRQTFDRLDVLVNNAGAIFDDEGGALQVPASTVLRSIDTNAMGAYRMTQALLPLMNAGGYGRVVNVSSGMGALTDMGGGWPGYRISKTALNAVTRLFAGTGSGDVKVNAVCPGWVRTDMGGAGASRSVEEGAAGITLAATLASDGPTGAFLRDGEVIDW